MTLLYSVLLASVLMATPFHGTSVSDSLQLLTGAYLQPNQKILSGDLPELADPAPPYSHPGTEAVEIYGSAAYFIRYKNEYEFEKAGAYEVVPLQLRYSSGVPINQTYAHDWDLQKWRIVTPGMPSYEIILGGGMTPSSSRPYATWPEDNPGRRVFVYYRQSDGSWMRSPSPIVGKLDGRWDDHHYGGNLFQPGSLHPNEIRTDRPIFYYTEKVTSESGGPDRTSIVAYELDSNLKPIRGPFLIVDSDQDPSTRRTIGGRLSEGARPFELRISGKTIFVMGFSSGDFCTDSYTMNFAYAEQPLGPWKVIRERDGSWKNFAQKFQSMHNLSWVGRPALYPKRTSSRLGLLFHATRKSILPHHNYTRWPDPTNEFQLWNFFRSIFKTEVQFTLTAQGDLQLEIGSPFH